jgi:hypothetical protein
MAALLAAAISLPFVIEAIQRQALVLNRSCQSADVVDNLAGLAIGLVIGALLGYAGSRIARSNAAPRRR